MSRTTEGPSRARAVATVERVLPWRRQVQTADALMPLLTAFRGRHPKDPASLIVQAYEAAAGVTSYLTGTPGVLGLIAVDAAVAVIEEVGVAALWEKAQRLTALLVERADARLGPLGARVTTPRDPDRRGAHVSVAHPQAWVWCRVLIDQARVIGDFRPPDVIRLGPAPLYTRYVDCFDAVEAMAEVFEAGLPASPPPGRVT